MVATFLCAGCRTQGRTGLGCASLETPVKQGYGKVTAARLRPLEAAAHAETLTIVVHGDAGPVPPDPLAPALLPAAEDEP